MLKNYLKDKLEVSVEELIIPSKFLSRQSYQNMSGMDQAYLHKPEQIRFFNSCLKTEENKY